MGRWVADEMTHLHENIEILFDAILHKTLPHCWTPDLKKMLLLV